MKKFTTVSILRKERSDNSNGIKSERLSFNILKFRRFTRAIFLFLVMCGASKFSNAATWYSKGTGAVNSLSSWNSLAAGTGSTPTTFGANGDIWIIQTSMTFNGVTWTVGTYTAGATPSSYTSVIQFNTTGSVITNKSTTNATSTLNLYGSLTMSAGDITAASALSGNGGVNNIYIWGGINLSGTAYMANPPYYNYIYMANTSSTALDPQLIANTSTSTNWAYTYFNVNASCIAQLNANLSTTSFLTVTNSGTLIVPSVSQVNGTGTFITASGSTLSVYSASGVNGAVATTATRTFTAGTNYIFNSTATAAWPTGASTFGAPASVTIQPGISVTSNAAVSPSSTLTVGTGSTFDMSTYALGGAFTPAITGTVSTACLASAIPSGKTWTGTINYYSTGSQAIIAGTSYNNLTFGTGTYASPAITVNGILTGGTGGVLTMGANTLSGTLTSAGTGTIQTQATTSAIPSGITWLQNISYNNGTGGQSIIAGTYNGGLTNGNTSGTNTASAALSVAGTFSLAAGSTLSESANNISLNGTLAGTGTLTSTTGVLTIAGASSTISGNVAVGNLTVANSFSVSASPTINGVLALGSSILTATISPTTSYTVSIGTTGSVTRSTGYVNGLLNKNIAGLSVINYEVGDADYAPVKLTLGGVTTASGYIAVQSNAGRDPNIASSTLNSIYNINHYWTIAEPVAASGFTSVDPLFTYNTADINIGGTGTSNTGYVAELWTGPAATAWNSYIAGTIDPSGTTTDAGALSSPSSYLGNFSVGKTTLTPPTYTAASGATVDNPFTISYTPANSTYDNAITSVTVGGTTLSVGAYTVNIGSGSITYNPSASALLQTSGTLSMVIVATGYAGSVLSQPLGAGAANHLAVTTQPTAPATNGGPLVSPYTVVKIEDQYNNVTASTASIVASATSGSWIIGGATTVGATAGAATFSALTAATSPAYPLTATITFTCGSLPSAVSASFNIPSGAITWYNKTSATDLSLLASWTNDPTGTGGGSFVSPTSFTLNNGTFHIDNGTNPTIVAGNLNVTGTGSSIVVGNGTSGVNFVIPAAYSVSATSGISISGSASVTTSYASLPTWGTLAATSTIIVSGSNSYIIPTGTYGNMVLGSAGSYTISTGTTTLAGSLTVSSGVLNGQGSAPTLNIGGDLNVTGTASLTNGPSYTHIFFSGASTFASPQHFNYTSSATSTYIYYNVNSGSALKLSSNLANTGYAVVINGTLDCNTYAVTGSGGVTLAAAGTLATANPAGVNASIAATGTNTFTAGANYIFYPSSAGTTGWPGTLGAPASVTINSSTVTATAAFSPTVTLTIASGATLDMSTYALGGTFTPAITGTLTTACLASAIPSGYTWGGTVNYRATGAQAVIAATSYNNLTFGAGTYTSAAITVNGTLTGNTSGVLNMGTNTLSGTLTSAGGGMIQTQATASALPSGITWLQTVSYNNLTGGQSIVSGTYNRGLINANTTSGINTAAAALSVAGTFSLAAGSTLSDGGNILSLNGTLAGTGTHTSTGSGAISITTGTSTISGNVILGNLTAASSFSLSANPTINGILALGNSVLTGTITPTTSYTVSIGSTGSVTRSAGYVNGLLSKNIAGLSSVSYEVGDADYAPVKITLGGVTAAAGYIAVQSNAGRDPNIASSTLNSIYNINHYWTIAEPVAASGFTSLDPLFTYNTADINVGGTGTSNAAYVAEVWTGPAATAWNAYIAGTTDPSGTTTDAGALSSSASYLGNFSIGKTTLTPPTYTAATGATVDNPFTISYTPASSTYDNAITSVTVGGTTLSAGAYTVNIGSGSITFNPAASTLLQTSGTLSVIVLAPGYAGSILSQPLSAGSATHLAVTTQPSAPATNGGALVSPYTVVKIEDQYNNVSSSTASVVASATGATWTIGGSTTVGAAGGVATFSTLTAATTPAYSLTATITFTCSSFPNVISSSFNIPAGPVTWYNTTTATDLSLLSSWTSSATGIGGTAPANFSTPLATYMITNGSLSQTVAGVWTVTGTGAAITVASAINFTIPAAYSVTATGGINVNNSSTLTLLNNKVPTLGTLGSSSTVVFGGSNSYTIPNKLYGNLTYSSTGAGAFNAGTYAIAGNYTQSAGTVTLASTAGTYSVGIGGTFTMSGSSMFQMSTSTGTAYVTVAGNVSINSSGSPALLFNSGASGTSTFQCNGATNTLNGSGTYLFDWGSETAATNNSMFGVTGNLTISGTGYLYTAGSSQSKGIVFNGSGTALSPQLFSNISTGTSTYSSYVVNSGTYVLLQSNLALGTGPANPSSSLTVNSGGILDCGTYVISGGASTYATSGLILNAGGTLSTANTSGISGSVTAAQTSYAAGANYVFYPSAASSAGWPVTFGAPASVSVNSSTVTANATFSPTVTLTVASGATLDMSTYALGGTFTPAITGTLTTACLASAIPSGFAWGGTVNYRATGSQAIIAATSYNNLTFGAGTYSSPAITVNGTLTGTAGGVLNMGTNALTGTLTSAGSGTIQTQAATSSIPSGKTWLQTISYNNLTGGQSIIGGTYNGGLINANTTSGVNTAAAALSVAGTFSLAAGSTLSDGGNILSLNGTLAGTGTHTSTGSGAVSITTGTSTISGNVTLGNLTAASSFSVSASPTVNGVLALGSSIITGTLTPTTSYTVSIGSTGSVTRSSGYVNALLSKNIAGLSVINYEVGDADYAPVKLTLGGATSATGYIAVESNAGHDPSLGSSTLDGVNDVSHYWTIAEPVAASGFTSIDPLFTYNTADINIGGTGTSNTGFVADVYSGSSWASYIAGTTNPTGTTTDAGALGSGYLGRFSIGKTTYTPPTYIAAIGATVDNPFTISYTPASSVYDNAVSYITVAGTTISAGAYTVNIGSGSITFNPAASTLLQTPGTLSIIVFATGYSGTSVSQPIAAGAGTKLVMSVQPGNPATNGGTPSPEPTVLIEDQYNNLSASTASITAAATGGTWTPGGTTVVAGVSGSAVFTGLTAATSGLPLSGATITFTSPGLTSVTSAAFNIPYGPFTWYSKAGTSLDLSVLTNWTSDPSGIGGGSYVSPSNFTNNGQTYIISNGITPTIAASWAVSGTGSSIQVGLASGASPLSFTNPTGHGYTISGTINVSANDTLVWGPTTGSNVPTLGTLAATSTVIYTGVTAYSAIPATSYGKFIYTSTANSTMSGGSFSAQYFTVNNSAGIIKMNNSTTSPTVTIYNDLNIMAGIFRLQGSSGSGSVTVNVNGNINLTSSTANIDFNASATGTNVINLTGNLNNTAGNLSTSQTVNGTLVFSGTGAQTYTNSSAVANGCVNFKVNAGASVQLENNLTLIGSATATKQSTFTVNGTLDVQGYTISSSTASSNFILNSGGTLKTSNSGGVDGSVSTTNMTLTYAAGANYVFYPVVSTATPFHSTITTNDPGNVYINSGIVTSNYNFSPSTSLTVASGATLNMSTYVLGGAFVPSNSGTIQTQNTSVAPVPASLNWGSTAAGLVQYNAGSGSQTVMPGTYYNLYSGNTSGINTAGGAITVNNNLELDPGTLNDNGYTINVHGNIQGAGSHSSGAGGSITMNGSLAQTISNATLGNLTLNNTSGFALSASPTTINGTLTMNGGSLTIGSDNLAFGPSATAIGGTFSSSNMIVANGSGQVMKYLNANGSFLFPIGNNAPAYSPVTLNFTGANGYTTSVSNVAVNVTAAVEPHDFSTTNYINRYWSIVLNSITTPNYSVTATYLPADVVGSESGIESGLYAGAGPWLRFAGIPVSHTLSAVALASGGNFTGLSSANPTVSVSPSASIVCGSSSPGSTLVATGSGTTPSVTYTWSPSTGLSAVTGATVVATPTTAGTYVYTVTLTDADGLTAVNTATVTFVSSQQWLGTSSANWGDAANWACGAVPGITDSVVIPGGTTFAPVLNVTTGNAKCLTVLSPGSLVLNSGNTLNISGNIYNSASITGPGMLYMQSSPSAAQTIKGNGTINNLTVNNSAGVSIGTSGDTLGIIGTFFLTSGVFTTNGALMLVSNSSGSATIGAITGGIISGNVVMQQYVPAGRRAYRFIAHPFSSSIPLSQIEPYIDITGSGPGFTSTISNAPSAYWYNPLYGNSTLGSDPGWRAFTSTFGTPDSNMVHRYEGIRLFYRGAKGEGLSGASYTVDGTTYRTYGPVNQGGLSVPMTKGGTNADYNLLGNPYPAVTDIGTVISNAATAGLVTGGAFYVWNPYMGTSGQFITETIGSAYYLGANESFELRTAANNNALSFSESNKGTTPTNGLMRNASSDYLTLYIYDSSYHPWDILNVKFDDAATDNEDAKYDGAKPPSSASLNFYSWSSDNSKLALDVRPFAAEKVIPLGITSSYTQDFIIKAENVALPAGSQIYLHDKYLQTYTQLQQGTEYKFTISKDAASQGDQRFELRTSPAGSAATAKASLDVQMVPNPATSDVTISYTATAKEQTSIRVLNVEGVTVLSQDLGMQQSGSVKLAVDKLASGVYMVELTSGTGKVVRRLIKE